MHFYLILSCLVLCWALKPNEIRFAALKVIKSGLINSPLGGEGGRGGVSPLPGLWGPFVSIESTLWPRASAIIFKAKESDAVLYCAVSLALAVIAVPVRAPERLLCPGAARVFRRGGEGGFSLSLS